MIKKLHELVIETKKFSDSLSIGFKTHFSLLHDLQLNWSNESVLAIQKIDKYLNSLKNQIKESSLKVFIKLIDNTYKVLNEKSIIMEGIINKELIKIKSDPKSNNFKKYNTIIDFFKYYSSFFSEKMRLDLMNMDIELAEKYIHEYNKIDKDELLRIYNDYINITVGKSQGFTSSDIGSMQHLKKLYGNNSSYLIADQTLDEKIFKNKTFLANKTKEIIVQLKSKKVSEPEFCVSNGQYVKLSIDTSDAFKQSLEEYGYNFWTTLSDKNINTKVSRTAFMDDSRFIPNITKSRLKIPLSNLYSNQRRELLFNKLVNHNILLDFSPIFKEYFLKAITYQVEKPSPEIFRNWVIKPIEEDCHSTHITPRPANIKPVITEYKSTLLEPQRPIHPSPSLLRPIAQSRPPTYQSTQPTNLVPEITVEYVLFQLKDGTKFYSSDIETKTGQVNYVNRFRYIGNNQYLYITEDIFDNLPVQIRNRFDNSQYRSSSLKKIAGNPGKAKSRDWEFSVGAASGKRLYGVQEIIRIDGIQYTIIVFDYLGGHL